MTTLTRKQLIAALTSANVEFDKKAKVTELQALYDKLNATEAVEEVAPVAEGEFESTEVPEVSFLVDATGETDQEQVFFPAALEGPSDPELEVMPDEAVVAVQEGLENYSAQNTVDLGLGDVSNEELERIIAESNADKASGIVDQLDVALAAAQKVLDAGGDMDAAEVALHEALSQETQEERILSEDNPELPAPPAEIVVKTDEELLEEARLAMTSTPPEELPEQEIADLQAIADAEKEAMKVSDPNAADFGDITPETVRATIIGDGFDFKSMMESIELEAAVKVTLAFRDAIAARKEFEKGIDPDNASIQRTPNKAEKDLCTSNCAKLTMMAGIDTSFVNRSVHADARYNVYAFGKFADLIRVLADGKSNNAINRAVLKSLVACHTAGLQFNMTIAKAAASDKDAVESPEYRKCLFRHTVSASTAPTQASSTMQALATAGIVTPTGSARNPIYKVNTESPLARRLFEVAPGL